MRKQLKTNGTKKARGRAWAKRVVSVLLAFAILPGMSGFIPAPAPSIVANSASAEASQSTALLFDGIANGTVMGDGVLIHYGVWDLAGMYEAAVSTGRYFTPGMIADALPFESDEVKAEFLAKYADGWYLVDQVYSKLLMPEWPGCIPELAEGEAESFMARSSAVYAVSRSGWQDVQFIVLGKNGEVFNIYVDADGTDAVKANIVEYAEAVEEIAEEPVTEPAGQQEQTLPAGAEEEGQPSDSAQPNEPAPESQPSAATLPAEQPEQATLPAGQPAGSAQGEPAAPEVGQGAETATPPAAGQSAETATLPAAEQAAETAAQPDGQQPETAIPETIIEEAVPPAGSAQAPQAGTEAGATEYAQSEAPTAPATEAEQAAAGADSPSIATAAPAQAEPSAPEATEPAAASAADSADSLGEGAATAEQAAPVTEEAAPTEQSAPAQEQGQPSGDSGLLAYIGSLYVPAAYANAEGLEPAEGGAAAPAADPADAAIAPEASAVPEAGPDAENTAPGGGAAGNIAEEAPAGIPAGDAAAEAPADAQGAAPELAGDSAEGDGAAAIGDAVPEEAADLPDGLVPEGAGTVSTLVETPIEINLDLNPLGEKVEIAAAPSVVTVLETKVLPAEPEPKPAQAVQAAQAVASLLKEAATGQSAVYAAYGDAVAGDIMYLPVNMYDYLGMQTGQMTGTFNHNMYLGGGDIATSYADSYQMRNLYFGVFTAPNSAALGRQNASTRVNNISQGVTLGIANPTLAQDASGKYEFALSSTLGLTTYNNAKLFPNTIADANTAMVDPRFGLQFPFVKGSDGFYRFDSDSSHVLVRDATAGNGYTMVLREGAQTSAGGSGPGWGGNTDLRTGGVGWFPFDTAAQTAAPNHNLYFGMSLDIPFVMPLDGIIGGEDMKFEFEGDDDIWIYIDGKLALDLGGKHDKEGGTINFATGLITVNHAAGRIPANINGALTGPTGDLYWNLYDAANAAVLGATLPAGKTIQGSLGIDRSTLSQHTLSMYFMERGGYGSNCNIKFNLPTFEPDKLNVFKFADAFTNPDEEFVFDAYKWNGDGAPLESDEGILSATEILKKDESFTVDVDYTENGGQWVRIVERPATVGSSEEEHSTITVREGAGTKSGKDSGWFWCPYQATKSLFFVNYKQKPIEIVKYRLDGASVGASGGTAYRTMAGVEFELYKYENGTATIVSNSLTTASDGRIYLNAKHIAGSPQILPDTEYCLVEKAPEYYEEAPEIYFSTTDGASPRVKDLWYYEGTGAGRTRIPDEKGLEQNTQLAFASENGVEIRIYNRREEGGLTIEKTIDEFYQTQGKPAFVFEVEKFPIAVDGEGNVVPGEEKLPGARMAIVDFGDVMDGSESNTRIAEIGGLDAGYFYRVSELGAMRYEQEGATLEGADDVDESGNTVTFLLEGDSDAIIVRFENAHNGTGYLGDVEAKVNSFRLSALPEPSAPVVCKVTVKKTNAPTATYTFDMIAGEFLDLTAFPAGVINPASDGLIGTVVGGGNFYVHTPIPADGCTINLRVP